MESVSIRPPRSRGFLLKVFPNVVLVHHNWKPEDGGELAPGQDEGIWNCEDVNIYTLQGL